MTASFLWGTVARERMGCIFGGREGGGWEGYVVESLPWNFGELWEIGQEPARGGN